MATRTGEIERLSPTNTGLTAERGREAKSAKRGLGHKVYREYERKRNTPERMTYV